MLTDAKLQEYFSEYLLTADTMLNTNGAADTSSMNSDDQPGHHTRQGTNMEKVFIVGGSGKVARHLAQ